MALIKMYETDFGFTYNGVSYDFEHIDSLTIEDPTSTKLIRGSNTRNNTGLVYVEGAKEPKRATVTIIGMDATMAGLLQQIYNTKDRCEFYAISRVDGSSKVGKQAIISQMPQYLTLDETAESMNITVIFETFDLTEVHKT